MKNSLALKNVVGWAGVICLLVSGVMAIGVYVGATISRGAPTPVMKLHAEAASGGKNVSLATGLIDDQIEGLYILDHLNGNLQCWVLNQRTGTVAGIYRANVIEGLGGVKRGGDLDFVMAVGRINFNARGSARPALGVCYVAEGNSGKVVGYGLEFDKSSAQRGVIQEGVLSIVCEGPIRDLQIRDQ